jgi:hypothetical protein
VQALRIGLFGAPAPCRPFRNNPDRSPEAKYLEATPQVGVEPGTTPILLRLLDVEVILLQLQPNAA